MARIATLHILRKIFNRLSHRTWLAFDKSTKNCWKLLLFSTKPSTGHHVPHKKFSHSTYLHDYYYRWVTFIINIFRISFVMWITLNVISIGGTGFHNSAVVVTPQDIAPIHSGSVFGLMNTFGAIPGKQWIPNKYLCLRVNFCLNLLSNLLSCKHEIIIQKIF